ncbi:hypothetical protein [Streptomyces sp. NPDC026673]|uniref:hypothetical protein n=1 Tax=Streptomyces sp. NPDC026673 TaxID=3155724 RepID=UPI0033CBDA79
MRRLAAAVHVEHPETHELLILLPGEDIDPVVAEVITNPDAWVDFEAPTIDDPALIGDEPAAPTFNDPDATTKRDPAPQPEPQPEAEPEPTAEAVAEPEPAPEAKPRTRTRKPVEEK